MLARFLFPIAVFLTALGVSAIQITAPNNQTGWETSGSQAISWSSVSTDPSNFTIYIIYPNTTSTSQNLIGSNVQTSDEKYTYTPTRTLDAGDGYRINFVSPNGGILAQSDYFSITTGTSTVSATSIVSATSVIGGPTTSQNSATTTATGTSSATSSAATTSKSSGAERIAVPSILLAIAGAIGLMA